jgi:nucleoside-diphosphate-sugar epimerase
MIGCHTARELVRQGDEITLFDLAPREDYVQRIVESDVRLVRGDLRDLPTVIEAVQDARPDVVIHTAGLISNAASDVPYRGFQINVVGTVNVAEAVRLTGVRRLLHASTLGVHDLAQPQMAPLTEDFPVGRGLRMYGASKVACEMLLTSYALHYKFELGLLRFASVYGYGHYAGGSGIGMGMNDLVRAAMAGKPAPLGSGFPEREEFVYVKDLARGVAAAARAEQLRNRVYNLGSGTLYTPEEVGAVVQRIIPGTQVVRVAPPRPEPFPRRQPMDLSRSRAELGYEPRFDIEAGIRDFIEEIKRERAA